MADEDKRTDQHEQGERRLLPGIFDYAPVSRSTAESVRRSFNLRRTLEGALTKFLRKTLPLEIVRNVGASYHQELFGKFYGFVGYDNPIILPGVLYLGWGDWNAFGKSLDDESTKSPDAPFEERFVNAAKLLIYSRMGLRPPAEALQHAMKVKKKFSSSLGEVLPYNLVELVADNLADFFAANLPNDLRQSFVEFDRQKLSVAKNSAYWEELGKSLTVLAFGWYETGKLRRRIIMPWKRELVYARSVYHYTQALDAARPDKPVLELARELDKTVKNENDAIAAVLEHYCLSQPNGYLVALLGCRSDSELKPVVMSCTKRGLKFVTVPIAEPGL